MKRYFSLSIFLFLSSLYTAAPPPPINPPTGLGGVAVPGRGPVAGTPTVAIAPGTAAARRVGPAVAPRAGRVVNPPTGLARVAAPGRGPLVGTPTNPLVQFAADQRRAAAEIARGGLRAPAPTAAAPLRPAPVAAPPAARPMSAPPTPVRVPAALLPRAPRVPAAAGNHMLTVINTTGAALRLFIVDDQGRTHEENLTAGTTINSIEIPDISVSAFVQNRGMCPPVSIDNNLKGIVIANNAGAGLATYTITPLIPQYEQYAFVYNQSTIQQLILLEINIPRAGVAGFLPTFIVGTHKLVFSKELNPQECCLLEIPNITQGVSTHNVPTIVTPTSIYLNVPTSNTGPNTLNTDQHNSFIITDGNDLVASA